MQNWNKFNELKNKAWQTKSQADYENWKEEFKTWYSQQELTDYEKKKIKEQLEVLNTKKNEYFEKQKQHPQIVKNSFIFQDKLADALTKYIELKVKMLELEYETKSSFKKE